MSKVFNMVGGGGGATASISVAGLSQTDTVTATNGSKTKTGVWTQIPNPALYVLPDGYTQLEYIESTGTQMIKTGIVNTSPNISVSCDFEYTSVTTEYPTIYGYINGSPYTNRMFLQYSNGNFSACVGTMSNLNVTTEMRKVYRTKLSYKNSVYSFEINGEILGASLSGTFSPRGNTKQIILFNQDESYDVSKGTFANAKMYSCSIEIDGNVLRDFIPAKRNSDSVIGLYDLVSETFFTNAGTGTFTAGPEIPQIIDGFLISKIKDYGTWTVKATDGKKTATQDVLVDVITEYEIEMSLSA